MWTARSGQPGYVQVTSAARTVFAPASTIGDARQRWLFRMVHTNRPLQEKMTLFWHNHFATGYTKIAGLTNTAEATRYMAAKASEDPARRARPDRDAARQRARQLPRHPREHRERHRDAVLARWLPRTRAPGRRRISAARSWSCSRWASATTPSPTSTRRRACSPAGTWRGREPPAARSTTSSSSTRGSTTPPRRPSAFRFTPTATRRFPRAPPPAACRTASISSTALAANPEHRPLPGEEAVPLLRLRGRRHS